MNLTPKPSTKSQKSFPMDPQCSMRKLFSLTIKILYRYKADS